MATDRSDVTHTLAPASPPAETVGLAGEGSPAGDGLPSVEGYEILSEIGRGGMGVVYLARQLGLGRRVALKMILSGEHASAPARLRFLAEAEALAGVRHPHVVPVYEFGTQAGGPFYSMEYLDGGSLADRIRDKPLSPVTAAELLANLAGAVDACHRAGVVHRDLKPANVLFASDGTPKVVDFGLAKRESSDLTATQAVMGTPAYMAPEQAAGNARAVGPETDVYGLGAILYECLTGRAPFHNGSAQTILELVRTRDPDPPRRINPQVPRDLDTVCLKCLEKDPRKRYASAEALAADLHRFREGAPVSARPVGRVERAVRWGRRNPALAGLAAALAGATVLGAVALLAVWAALSIREANSRLSLALGQAQDAQLAERRSREDEQSARQLAEEARQDEAKARAQLQVVDYRHRVDLALREWHGHDLTRARGLLDGCAEPLRGWEWHYVRRLCDPYPGAFRGHRSSIKTVTYSPDAEWAASADRDTVKVWSAVTGAERTSVSAADITRLSLSVNAERVAGANTEFVFVWDTTTRGEVFRFHWPLSSPAAAVALSTDGRLLAAGEYHRLWLWDLSAAPKAVALDPVPKQAMNVVFTDLALSPDGRVLAAAAGPDLHLWDTASGRRLTSTALPPSDQKGNVTALAFDPDGRPMAVTANRGLVYYRRAADGPGWVADYDGRAPGTAARFAFPTGGPPRALFLLDPQWRRPDDSALDVPGPHLIVREVGTPSREVGRLNRGHNEPVTAFDFRRDGRQMATVDADSRIVKLWMVGPDVSPAGSERIVLAGPALDWSMSAGGRYLAGWRDGQPPAVWDLGNRKRWPARLPDHRRCLAVHLPDDGRTVTTVDSRGDQSLAIRTFDSATGNEAGATRVVPGYDGEAVQLSPDGRLLMLLHVRPDAKYRRPTDPPGELPLAGPPVRLPDEKMRWSDGGWPKYTATLIDVATGTTVRVTPALHTRSAFQFTADSRAVAVLDQRHLRLWGRSQRADTVIDVGRGRLSGRVTEPDRFEVGPDGTVITWGARRMLFARPGGEQVVVAPRFGCQAAALSPDGRRAVLCVGTGVQVWDTEAGAQTLGLELGGTVLGARFTADGRRVVAFVAEGGRRLAHVFDATPLPNQ